jgi:branched-chain amino acid transport system ATP-binding protein
VSPPVLAVVDLRHSFGGVQALDGVSLEAADGERYAIVGPNGAGKTTLFNAVAGELRVQRGTIRLHGRDVTGASMSERVALGIGRTFQHVNLFPSLTPRQSLLLATRASRGARSASGRRRREAEAAHRCEEILELTALGPVADVPTSELGHGHCRQLELALGLGADPDVLLLDEPAAGLSPGDAAALVKLIGELPRSLTTIIIEHDMDVVFALADKITVMHDGRVVMTGIPADVSQNAEVLDVYLGIDE